MDIVIGYHTRLPKSEQLTILNNPISDRHPSESVALEGVGPRANRVRLECDKFAGYGIARLVYLP